MELFTGMPNRSPTIIKEVKACEYTSEKRKMISVIRVWGIATLAVIVLVPCTAVADMVANVEQQQQQQCGLYLAISSTSTDADPKWGLFAGKDIPPQIPIGSPDIGVLSHDLRTHSYFVDEDEDVKIHMNEIADFFDLFFWSPDTVGAHDELKTDKDLAAILGFGTLSAYNPKLTNADWNRTAVYYRNLHGEIPGESHPGRGASTSFYNAQVVSVKEISAGTEIFIEHGQDWTAEVEADGQLKKDDYAKIDHVVNHMVQFFEKHKDVMDEVSKQTVYKFITSDVLKAAAGDSKARRISKLLPANPDDLNKVQETGGSLAYSDPKVYRTAKWLTEFGLCVDHLQPGTSTVPNAGRGAFASRRIRQGRLVAPVPLIQVPDKRVLNMYKLSVNKKEYVKESETPIGTQLLENYCFGHPQSNMLFFPAAPVVGLINHSERSNAKLVWSSHPNHQNSWFEVDPADLISEEYQYIGLMMEVVATRDIEPGEEIFIDYGPEWKYAWEKHANEWNMKVERGDIPKKWPMKALDMNAKYSTTAFETEDELNNEPYPENVVLKAFIGIKDGNENSSLEDPMTWENTENAAFQWDHLFPISVVRRVKLEGNGDDPMPYSYTVRLEVGKRKKSMMIISQVPHKALVFMDKPGTSDQFFPNPFRHYIGIPDEIFPEGAWRNTETE